MKKRITKFILAILEVAMVFLLSIFFEVIGMTILAKYLGVDIHSFNEDFQSFFWGISLFVFLMMYALILAVEAITSGLLDHLQSLIASLKRNKSVSQSHE
jgi:hypothetical protein